MTGGELDTPEQQCSYTRNTLLDIMAAIEETIRKDFENYRTLLKERGAAMRDMYVTLGAAGLLIFVTPGETPLERMMSLALGLGLLYVGADRGTTYYNSKREVEKLEQEYLQTGDAHVLNNHNPTAV